MMRARVSGGVVAQPGNASAAFFTAASSSAFEARATLAWTSPVAGLKTSAVRPLLPLDFLAADEVMDGPALRSPG